MLHRFLPTRRRILRALFAIGFAAPLMAADCSDLTGSSSSSAKFDGTYSLRRFDGKSLPTCIICVDSRNQLILYQGDWTVSGTSVSTAMYTKQMINGTTTTDSRFWPERHTGTISVSGSSATITLDTGNRVYASLESGGLTYTSGGHTYYFEKQ